MEGVFLGFRLEEGAVLHLVEGAVGQAAFLLVVDNKNELCNRGRACEVGQGGDKSNPLELK